MATKKGKSGAKGGFAGQLKAMMGSDMRPESMAKLGAKKMPKGKHKGTKTTSC